MKTKGWKTFSEKGQRGSISGFVVQNGLYGNYSTLLLQCNHITIHKPQALWDSDKTIYKNGHVGCATEAGHSLPAPDLDVAYVGDPRSQIPSLHNQNFQWSAPHLGSLKQPVSRPAPQPIPHLPSGLQWSKTLFQTASLPHASRLYFCPWHWSLPSILHDLLTPFTYYHPSLPTRMSARWEQVWSVLFIELFPAPKAVPGP